MEKPEQLSPKRALFVQEYLVDFNAMAAAKRAGYSDTYSVRASTDLLKNPQIKNEIDKRLAEREKRVIKNAGWVLEKITEIAERGKSENNRVKALELLGKHFAMFVDRQSLENPDGSPIFSGEVTVRLVKGDE